MGPFYLSDPARLWKRYVDDTCMPVKSDLVESFHLHQNSVEQMIQFTIKSETDGDTDF